MDESEKQSENGKGIQGAMNVLEVTLEKKENDLQKAILREKNKSDELKQQKKHKDTQGNDRNLTDNVLNLIRLAEGNIKDDELTLFTNILTSRGDLVEKQESLDFLVPMLQEIEEALISIYSNQIGERKIQKFFSELSTDRILLVKDDRFDTIVQDFKSTDRREKRGGAFDPVSRLTFIRESDHMERSLTEELMHNFLDHQAGSRIPPINLIRLLRRNNESTDYFSKPQEQIVKAMVCQVLHTIKKEYQLSDMHNYNLSAEMGEKRILELGWHQILKGNYSTDHEQDFKVEIRNNTTK